MQNLNKKNKKNKKSMMLLTKKHRVKLRANAHKVAPLKDQSKADLDLKPVVCLFTVGVGCKWLLTELNDDEDTLFGLCDYGNGTVELGFVSLKYLQMLRGPLGLRVERDKIFKATKLLAEYMKIAKNLGRIEYTL